METMQKIAFFSGVAKPAERLAACRVLTGGFPTQQREPAAKWLLSRFDEGLMNVHGLFVARNVAGVIFAAASLHLDEGAGATMTSFRSAPGTHQQGAEDSLIAAIDQHLRGQGVKVCQLIGNPAKAEEYRGLVRNGYLPPSRLVEMAIDTFPEPSSSSESTVIGPAVEIVPFREERAREFAELLCETYVGTLDCPELNDVRTPGETLASLRGNSRAEQPHWSFVEVAGHPIGVVMLNPATAPQKWELTYLGLVPSHRFQGFGKALLTVALATARDNRASGMILTTDSRNLPAIRLYESAGFRPCGSYDVFLKLFNR
ncbi:MAG: GNAT family N-acetyltransferase [Gemmataceae bacterium]